MKLVAATLLLPMLLAVAACGGSSAPPRPALHLTPLQAHGKKLFVAQCGVCHRLADARTSGSAGTKLDGTALSEGLVLKAIVEGRSSMPANIVRGLDAQSVAAYVARATK